MQVNQNRGESNIMRQIWFKYAPYWPLFLLFFMLAVVGAWYYLKFQPSIYVSKASILIKDQSKGEDDAKIAESINLLSAKKTVDNEMEVLKSKELMVKVVKKLHLYAPVSEKGRYKDRSAYTSSPIFIESPDPDSLEGTDKVFFTYDKASKSVTINNVQYPCGNWVNTPFGTLKFMQQNSNVHPDGQLYFTLSKPDNVALDLVNSLSLTPASKMSSVIDLTFSDEVPKRSEDILNELMKAYNDAAVNDKNRLAANTLAWLDERLGVVGHELDSIERKLQQYKTRTNAIDISSQGTLYLQNVSSNDQRLSDVNTQLSVLDQVEKYVMAKDNSASVTPSTIGINDPMLSQMLGTLYNDQLQYEKLKRTIPENNPILLSLKDQIDKIKPGILDNINSQRQSLEANKSSLSSINNRYSSVLQSIPQKEKDLVEISRQQAIKSESYNYLLQKRDETALSLVSSIGNSKIIDQAHSSFGPISPKTKFIYAAAVLLALAFAVGLIWMYENFKGTILYRQEIESYTSIPVIGEVMYQRSKEPLVIGDGKRTFIAEQFRNLRTTLPYIGLSGGRKRLQVTSSVSGEGKSFIAANLAIGLAMTGKKVVAVEFDLSDPTLSDKLKVTEVNKGLTDYLTAQAEPEDIIQKVPVQENLYVVSAGWLPENPSELILSEKVPELMKYLSDNFDYIIIDTAPVGLLSDAYVLSAYCDATLFVVRHKHTRKASVQRLDINNKINELKNMAIVFNGVRARGFGKNGYGYGYGYGYVYRESKKKRKLLGKTGVF
jgi:capsular exopolysaccharide synthesis family protein